MTLEGFEKWIQAMWTCRGQVEGGVEGEEREDTHQVKVLEAEF